MIDLDQVQTLSNDQLASIRDRLNKEIERRSGADIDIKKIRSQVYKLAKALGCEWIAETYSEDRLQDTDKTRRRGRNLKTEGTTTETVGGPQTKLQEAPAQVRSTPGDEEKRNPYGIYSHSWCGAMNRTERMQLDRTRFLLTLSEAAEVLSVTTRTVQRLIERGELPKVKIGRCLRVPAQAVQAWVDKQIVHTHNELRAGLGVRRKEVSACHTDAKIVPFGGCPTPKQTEKELDALLRPRTERRPKR